ncbi:MAG: hypothetical protein FJZ87_08450 [Chloroflexi bacterium]|nr:hypothetical protein [Chloroflexota bacterium]
MIPDADGYPQAVAILAQRMDPHLAESIFHRTFTHTLFFPLSLALIFLTVYWINHDQSLLNFGLGLAGGSALLHSPVDILGFFDGVGLLWPIWSFNLYADISLTDHQIQMLRSVNFLAFALYFWYLHSLAGITTRNQACQPRLRWHLFGQAGLFVVFFTLTLILPFNAYNTVDGAVFLIVAFPNVLWVTWKMWETIEAQNNLITDWARWNPASEAAG